MCKVLSWFDCVTSFCRSLTSQVHREELDAMPVVHVYAICFVHCIVCTRHSALMSRVYFNCSQILRNFSHLTTHCWCVIAYVRCFLRSRAHCNVWRKVHFCSAWIFRVNLLVPFTKKNTTIDTCTIVIKMRIFFKTIVHLAEDPCYVRKIIKAGSDTVERSWASFSRVPESLLVVDFRFRYNTEISRRIIMVNWKSKEC